MIPRAFAYERPESVADAAGSERRRGRPAGLPSVTAEAATASVAGSPPGAAAADPRGGVVWPELPESASTRASLPYLSISARKSRA